MILPPIGSMLIGFMIGGRDPGVHNVTGLGTAQRNISAAIVVAAQNFPVGDTLSFILVASILLLLVLLPAAKRMGARAQATVSASDKADLKA